MIKGTNSFYPKNVRPLFQTEFYDGLALPLRGSANHDDGKARPFERARSAPCEKRSLLQAILSGEMQPQH